MPANSRWDLIRRLRVNKPVLEDTSLLQCYTMSNGNELPMSQRSTITPPSDSHPQDGSTTGL